MNPRSRPDIANEEGSVNVETPTQVLQAAELAAAQLEPAVLSAVVRATLRMSQDAILVTDLDHRPWACNARFGVIFAVDPDAVPGMAVEELRGYVTPRLADVDRWRRQLDEIYAAPAEEFRDQLELVGEPTVMLERVTRPVLDDDEQVIGRIWSFRDVTEAHRRALRRDLLDRTSAFHHPDPREVCQRIVEELAAFYDSTAVLSLREGDFMHYTAYANVPDWAHGIPGNDVSNTFCKLTMNREAAVIVQDGRAEPEFAQMPIVQAGMTRYLGAPIRDGGGQVCGTICLVDGRSDLPHNEDDLVLLTIMASRLSTELERERLQAARIEQERAVAERLSADLQRTRDVLAAMNASVGMLERRPTLDALLADQVSLWRGLLGVRALAVGTTDPMMAWFDQGAGTEQSALAEPVEGATLGEQLWGEPGVLVRPHQPDAEVFLWVSQETDLGDAATTIHREAIVEQIALLVQITKLHNELDQAHGDLRNAHQRMIQAEKLSVVGTLAATVAHDIKNIMASISLACEIGRDEPAQALAEVRGQVDRFTVLAHRLLSYARPKQLAQEQIRLDDVLDRSLALLDAQIRIAGVRVERQTRGRAGTVLADPHRVEHLFVNLVMNALQAIPPQGGVLRIETEHRPQSTVVTIADNGKGIPDELLVDLFQPFVSSRSDGFGLGLYSCRTIAEEHGWRLDVASEVGRGTTFTLRTAGGNA